MVLPEVKNPRLIQTREGAMALMACRRWGSFMALIEFDNGTKFDTSPHSKERCARSGNKPDMTLARGLLLRSSRSHMSGTKVCQCSNKDVLGIIFNPTLLNQPRNTITQLFCNSKTNGFILAGTLVAQKREWAGA
jgi:hypothetical protein